jgi:signal transduction histidine kinase
MVGLINEDEGNHSIRLFLRDATVVSEPSGTRLSISGNQELLEEWTQRQFEKLRFELKKLISPVSAAISEVLNDDKFNINLEVSGFPDVHNITESIEPYPIFDLFDYRIAGRIAADGTGTLKYSLQKARNTAEEAILFDDGKSTGCGEMVFDIRVYDRDADSISSLIGRGLKDETGNYVGKHQARQLLNEYNGIGVYRNGFRIRPLGDAAFDWVELNKRRVQNPSKFIGSDQAIGYVVVQSDEESGLIEKSARDGLKENAAYDSLKKITTLIISKLEERRFSYRLQAGLGRSAKNIDSKIERLFSPDELKKTVRSTLLKFGVGHEVVADVIEIISKDADEKNKVADEIRQAVAIYQGQATLGKIINVILHEGRRPLNYFQNQIPNLRYWFDSFLKTRDVQKLEQFMPIAEGVGENAEFFVKLFSRLDPLAAGKRTAKKPLELKKVIWKCFSVFNEEMRVHDVVAKVEGADNIVFSSWPQDIYAIFTNLIDNSIFWMREKDCAEKEIIINVVADGDSLSYIDYRDTGPGIEPYLIASEVIFEPSFSTKPSGTGLGLAIAGEAANRNGLELKAFESELGVWFRLQPITDTE